MLEKLSKAMKNQASQMNYRSHIGQHPCFANEIRRFIAAHALSDYLMPELNYINWLVS